ncbi:MAG: hypothetical protein P8X58_00955 [Syntrophobacterales bacterium]
MVTAVIAAVVLAYAVHLSAPGRGVVDWIVMGVVVAAILWSLQGLGRRLYRAGGGQALGHLPRTLAFWLVGLMNTVWAVPGQGRTWKWWIGVVLLTLAVVDSMLLFRKEQRLREPGVGPAAPGVE